jgi:transcriptional regulator with XRE-family HTH domain
MNFSDKMRQLRAGKEMKQRELADALGIKLSNLASYEEGRAYPKPEVLKRIVDYFGIANPEEELYKFLFTETE